MGQTLNFTSSFLTNDLASSVIAGVQMPAIGTLINNDNASNFLVVGGIFNKRTADVSTNTTVVVTTFTFPTPVRDVTVTASDIDFTSNQFRDWFMAVGRNGASSYVPAIVTPFGQANVTGPFTNASSSLMLGPNSFAATAAQAVGTGASGNNSNTGDITLSFAQPVTSVELRYGNYPLQAGETVTGQQGIGFSGVSFCPMPVVTIAKITTPWSDPQNGTANPKLIPGGDLIYTLTVANANTSPVDLSTTILTDPIPATLTFYNGDIDDAGPLTTNFDFNAGASGLTFAAANLSYSNNGGASYAYTPAAGYDPAVNALRFAPAGSMAANSSFTIKFRARIK
ncbi:MAG: hypothetical protein H0X36_08665 [Sphingomonadaceae bacterium]|nr:hypothetical protein [Sphingomonadaceae bacterium]